MLRRILIVTTALTAMVLPMIAAEATSQQPVYIFLYTRVTDHLNIARSAERIAFTKEKMLKYRKQYPQYRPSALLQVSGAVSVVLEARNPYDHFVDAMKAAAEQGALEFGYSGEDEPSYQRHPQPRLLNADTPELRWDARLEATEQFLTEYKDPLTGEPVRLEGMTGGLLKMQQVFGEASFVSGIVPDLVGGLSPAHHILKKYNQHAVLLGIPYGDPRAVIEGFAPASATFSRTMSPLAANAPEVFWEDGYLRISQTSLPDSVLIRTGDGAAALQKFFGKLDRSHVRVVPVEYADYMRYLAKHPDGVPKYPPLEYAYAHPDAPFLAGSTKAYSRLDALSQSYQDEDAAMEWLFRDFFPKNPGSRFISMEELKQLAVSETGSEFTHEEMLEMAKNLAAGFRLYNTSAPALARAGDRFVSLADAFLLFAEALGNSNDGSPAAPVMLTPMYGPLTVALDNGPAGAKVTARAVNEVAAGLVARMQNTDWKPVPDNTVPVRVQLGDLSLTPAQFLRLMVDSYLAPGPDASLTVEGTGIAYSTAFGSYPRNFQPYDASNGWTFTPAPLKAPASVQERVSSTDSSAGIR